jgi:hypothetical protein
MATNWIDRHGDRQTSTWRERDVRDRWWFKSLESAELAVGLLREAGYDRVEIVTP